MDEPDEWLSPGLTPGPADPAVVEHLAQLMPPPVRREWRPDGRVVLTGGEPGEVGVTVTASAVEVAVFAVRWDGPHTHVVAPARREVWPWGHCPRLAVFRRRAL